MANDGTFGVVVELLNGLETLELTECDDIIMDIKTCAACDNDFGIITRTILMDLLMCSNITCPIAIGKMYVQKINETEYVSDEPEAFHSLVWMLQILIL